MAEMHDAGRSDHSRLITRLAQLLESTPTTPSAAVDIACRSVGEALSADQAEVFLYDPASESLLVAGVSNTSLVGKEHALGLDRLPLASGGRVVEVFQTGIAHRGGSARQDPGEPASLMQGLGVQSLMATTVRLGEAQRGVLVAMSMREEQFGEEDLDFLHAVALWLGLVAQKAVLLEQLRRPRAERQRKEKLARRRVKDLEAGVEEVHASVAQVRQACTKAQLELTAIQGEVAMLQIALTQFEDELVQRSRASERERFLREQLEEDLRNAEEKLRHAEEQIASLEAQMQG